MILRIGWFNMKKKYNIAIQAGILGLVLLGGFLFYNYLDDKKSDKQPHDQNEYTTTTQNSWSKDLHEMNSPRYEYVETEYVYCPEEPMWETVKYMEIPWGDCSNMAYMDFRTLTDVASAQWELQQYAWTDWQGFRRIGDDYCVALGTYYGQVGDRFRITTDKGNVYTVIEADAKGYAVSYDGYHTWYHVCGDGRINVVEFVVDTYCLDSYALTMGDCNVIDNIGGNIISIERLSDWG